MPRFDSPATFCALLDPAGGHWSLSPRDVFSVQREYVPESVMLRTTARARRGAVVITDAVARGADERGHDIGLAPPQVILRVIECTAGEVELDVEVAIRSEYGLTVPVLQPVDGGIEIVAAPWPTCSVATLNSTARMA